ncbi:protein of unknown function DUF3310 [Vibrio phage 1.088.O._10N.261.46.A1]|nr:protein of unknown function DUF3310 [Vibrio phage 1.088.O._10N.261.46.A1]
MRPDNLYPTLDEALGAQPTCTHVLRRTVRHEYDFVPVNYLNSTTFQGFETPMHLEYDVELTEWEAVYDNDVGAAFPQPTTDQRVTAARFDQAASQVATDRQIGGDHYKSLKIQPIEYIDANNLPFLEGNVVKYVTRHTSKNGVQDIDKAIHYLELIKQMRYAEEQK